jgi:plastocyanin
MPFAPKLANRRVPEGGFDSISRMKNGAAIAAFRARDRKDRRSVITGSYYALRYHIVNASVRIAALKESALYTDLLLMVVSSLRSALAIVLFAGSLSRATDIQGNIIIQRKLTKRRVTAAMGAYDRGTPVDLKKDSLEDALAFERERVVIYLEGEIPSQKGAITAEIAQQNRRFVPDTLWIPVGSTVSFPNLDPIFHNVFSLSKPKEFDLGNYPKDHTRTVVFQKPGVVFVNCHLHPNMSAAIIISPNRWGVKAGPDGKFTLADVPRGTHTIVAWHKTAGFFRHQITIGDKPVAVEFFIPLGEEPGTHEH